jgi:predicted nucleic acid-binding protein
VARTQVEAVFDTGILHDYLTGREEARREFVRYTRRGISIVTWIELQGESRDKGEADVMDLFFRDFRVIEITRAIARRAVEIRRSSGMRLPDAIVWATAQVESAVLVTRNTADFPANDAAIRVPY